MILIAFMVFLIGLVLAIVWYLLTSNTYRMNLQPSNVQGVLPVIPDSAYDHIVFDNVSNAYVINTSRTGSGMVHISGPEGEGLYVCIAPKDEENKSVALYQDGWHPLKYGSGDYDVFVGALKPDGGAHLKRIYSFTATFKESDSWRFENTYSAYSENGPVATVAAQIKERHKTNSKIAYAIQSKVWSQITYCPDPDKADPDDMEGYPTADEIWAAQKGTCQNYASVACAMFKSVGIPAYIRISDPKAGDNGTLPSHAWVAYLDDDGTWQCIDPTDGCSILSEKPTDNPLLQQ